jgi:hypothetical protein
MIVVFAIDTSRIRKRHFGDFTTVESRSPVMSTVGNRSGLVYKIIAGITCTRAFRFLCEFITRNSFSTEGSTLKILRESYKLNRDNHSKKKTVGFMFEQMF